MRFTTVLFLTMLGLAQAEDLRLLSFNIRYDRPDPGVRAWGERREAVVAIIREQADVAGLQEVLPQQRRELAERCAEFVSVGVGRESGDLGEASPVLVRRERLAVLESGTFWFSETPEVVGSKSWGHDIPRLCTWVKLREVKGGAVFWFYNVHLDHRSQPARERSTALLLARIAARGGGEPVIIGGDFNATPENAALGALTAAGLASVYPLAGVAAEGTFHDFTGKPTFAAIDFFFLDPKRWKVSAMEIIRSTFRASDGSTAWPSDHFPIRASVALLPVEPPAP